MLVFLLLSPSAVSALTQSEYEAVYKRTMRHLGKNKFRGILPSLVRLGRRGLKNCKKICTH